MLSYPLPYSLYAEELIDQALFLVLLPHVIEYSDILTHDEGWY